MLVVCESLLRKITHIYSGYYCGGIDAIMKTRVLLVDDDPEVLDVVRILMQQQTPELEIVTTETVKEALEKLEKEKFDIVIADYLIPDSSGLDLLEAIRSRGNEIIFVIWTGHSQEDIAIRALNLGANYYILKGADLKEQFLTIREIIGKITAKKEDTGTRIDQKKASEFIHKLSHDITGIVHNIMGYATLLEEEFDKSYIEGIGRLTNKLTTRVKSAVSEIDSGELNEL